MGGEIKGRIVITGGSSGIGLETARRLAAVGAAVCVVGRRPEVLESAVACLGDRCWAHSCDVADPEQLTRLAEAVASRWDGVDGLVNSAGFALMATLEETTLKDWDLSFAVNLRGPYLLTRLLLPLLRAAPGSAIVNVSSTLAEKAIPGMAANSHPW